MDIEQDWRYRRADLSMLHAFTARWRFAMNIARGEPGVSLAEAALLITAEDDAIASHSTVAFPVESYLQRIQKLADEFERQRLRPMAAATGGRADTLQPERVLDELSAYLFETQRFSAPACGRSNLPKDAMLDHPGVWEDARVAYLNETLIRKHGHPAALAILYAEVMRRLLSTGAIDFAISMDTAGFDGLPRPVLLPGMTRDMLLQPTAASDSGNSRAGSHSGGRGGAGRGVGGSGAHDREMSVALNTVTSDTLAELLRHLKRAYWPLPWDTSVDAHEDGGAGSHGGFRPAAKAATGDEMSAQLAAVSQVASWRLERGVWTSPGAGDIRRCRAACERLVLMEDASAGGAASGAERRDLAAVLFHSGELAGAAAELDVYMSGPHFRGCSDAMDRALCRSMMGALRGVAGNVAKAEPMSLGATVGGPMPEEVEFDERKMPLTW